MQANGGKEDHISTFVFMDFETTGLLDNRKRPRITEMSFIAVNRVDLVHNSMFPRVTNKLTLCLDPQKPVSHFSSEITGLFNDNLEFQKPFAVCTVQLLNNFLDHLAQPVCLLAHNGNGFDFLLLNSELKRINQSLNSSLLCADTLEAFRSLDGLPARYVPLTDQNFQTPLKSQDNNTNPPAVKRKLQSDLEETHTACVKNQKLSCESDQPTEQKSSQSNDVEKVKKQLSFDENIDQNTQASVQLNTALGVCELHDLSSKEMAFKITDTSDSDDKSDDKVNSTISEVPNTVDTNGDKQEQVGSSERMCSTSDEKCESFERHFSGSLEDCVYFEALEEAEKQHAETKAKNLTNEECEKEESTTGSQLPLKSTTEVTAHLQENSVDSITTLSSPSSVSTASETTSAATSVTTHSNQPLSPVTTTASSSVSSVSSTLQPKPSTSSPPSVPVVKRNSYKLEELYCRLYGQKPPKSHMAENDCITLIYVAKKSPGFLEWVDQNAVLLNSVEPPY